MGDQGVLQVGARVTRAVGRDDVRHDSLAGLVVGHPDDGRVGDTVDLAQDVLDLGRVDVEAADDDQLLDPVDQKQVAGCIDVDLNFSPSTNLLPIRRRATDVRTAWLRFPSFALELLEQRYTYLADDRVRYESFTTNFAAELRISPNGLVLDYENIWSAER